MRGYIIRYFPPTLRTNDAGEALARQSGRQPTLLLLLRKCDAFGGTDAIFRAHAGWKTTVFSGSAVLKNSKRTVGTRRRGTLSWAASSSRWGKRRRPRRRRAPPQYGTRVSLEPRLSNSRLVREFL